jgi:hypothetical protein
MGPTYLCGEKIAGGEIEVGFTTGKGRQVISMFFSYRDISSLTHYSNR